MPNLQRLEGSASLHSYSTTTRMPSSRPRPCRTPNRCHSKGQFSIAPLAPAHVVAAVPESVVRSCIHIFVRVIHGGFSMAIAILNEVGGGKPSPGKHRIVIVLLRRARPAFPEVGALDNARILRCLAPVKIAAILSIKVAATTR